MRKIGWVLFFIALGLIFSASTTFSEMAEEGSHSGKNYSTGTSKAIQAYTSATKRMAS